MILLYQKPFVPCSLILVIRSIYLFIRARKAHVNIDTLMMTGTRVDGKISRQSSCILIESYKIVCHNIWWINFGVYFTWFIRKIDWAFCVCGECMRFYIVWYSSYFVKLELDIRHGSLLDSLTENQYFSNEKVTTGVCNQASTQTLA